MSAPEFFVECQDCVGGVIPKRVTVYEGGGWYYDTEEQPCPKCHGTGMVETGWEPDHRACDLGVGCEEYGVCYAAANGEPERCGRIPAPKPPVQP